MRLKILVEKFGQCLLNKRMYWQLGRERLLPLLEYQELLAHHDRCQAIEIRKDGIIIVSPGGGRMYFDFSQTVCRAESILLATENENWSFIQALLPKTGVFLDIGANVGWFSLNIHQSLPNAEIYAFEPVKDTFNKMQKNLVLNQAEHCIRALNIGFYNQVGQQSFFVPAANEAASLRPNMDSFYLQQGNVGQAEIKSELKEIICDFDTLDHFVMRQGISRVDFIKCDVEGAEKMVFEGGRELFQQYKPMIYTEMLRKHAKRFGYHPNAIIQMFQQWGYQCYQLNQENRLQELNQMNDDTAETNFFFLHQGKHKAIIEKYGV